MRVKVCALLSDGFCMGKDCLTGDWNFYQFWLLMITLNRDFFFVQNPTQTLKILDFFAFMCMYRLRMDGDNCWINFVDFADGAQ